MGRRDAVRTLNERLREVLKRRGIKELTPIQQISIPTILRGFHTLIMAPTGSGKTEAALLPVASKMLDEGVFGKLTVLYITPLRALNRDIGIRALSLFREIGMNVDVWHGDTPQSRRKRIMEQPPEVLVTTPESLNILLVNRKMRKHLRSVKYVIIDELHELMESKRGAELTVALERLSLIARFQRIGISATISNVEVAKRFLGGPRYVVEVLDKSRKAPEIDVVIEEGFENMLKKVEEMIVNIDGALLIFTNTRDTAEQIGKALKEKLGDKVFVHHGSLSKSEREKVEKLIRSGKTKAVVATSSLELGIDVGSITHVIQFASPRRVTRLVQRIGRAKHDPRQRPKGTVISGLKPYEVLEAVVIARRAIKGDLEELRPYSNPLDVLAHQLVGMFMEEERDPKECYRVVQRAYPFWNLSLEEFEEIMNLLSSIRLIECKEGRCRATRKGEIYYRTTGMIVESKRVPVKVYGGEVIGTLDEEFVVELNPSDRFILGGRIWKVVGLDEDVVIVEKDEGIGPPPAWEGDLIPVDFKVAREVGALKRMVEKMIDNYPLDDRNKRKVLDIIKESGEPRATDKRIVIEVEGNTIVYNIHGGSNINNALGYALSYIARLRYGSSSFNTTPYHVILILPKVITADEAKDILLSLKNFNLKRLVMEEVKKSRLFKWRMIKVMVRMGIINRKRLTVDELRKIEKGLLRVYRDSVVGNETLREILHDKVDIDGLLKLIEGIESMEVISRAKFSNQSLWALENESKVKEVSVSPSSTILNVVRRRLENREVKMICMMCGYQWSGKVRDVGLKCPKCQAGFVAPSFNEEMLEKVALKIARNEKIKGEEKRTAKEVRERANLLMVYGRDALLALAARGVGAQTAKRVLAASRTGSDLLTEIIKAEKTFIRTKRYW
ncbi:hypothetical protein IPA_05060 [Ignicoccus pacificus DSM 13166]|uniref:DEAD/DEAH box helicase n=1 Tax=Ignicoccus pacificus DSM 13166 TaxID=940294 RepID=A0A977KBA3_9CREN|nr:hypothetical protein IPA_05060 [Ignicoccus pacificus DSM 13166]